MLFRSVSQSRYQGQISWEEAWGKANEGDENEEQDEGEKILEPSPVKLQPSEILDKIYDWWTENRSELISEYEDLIYPKIDIGSKISTEDTTNTLPLTVSEAVAPPPEIEID